MDLYMNERDGKFKTNCPSQSPIPSTSAKLSSYPWGQAGALRAGEAGGCGAKMVGAGEVGCGRQ